MSEVNKSDWDTASNPIIGYADSYRQMARTGTTSIDVWSIITDLERNMAPLMTAAQSELAALREELETAKDDLVIFKGGLSALGEASKKLVFCARTTGGTAGPDQGLMDACASVEGTITLAGIARSIDELEQLTAERDDLKARLEHARDRKNSIVDLQQRLTDAERRNAVLTEALEDLLKGTGNSPGSNKRYAKAREALKFRGHDAAERDHEIPGTSGMRLNMLANQGE